MTEQLQPELGSGALRERLEPEVLALLKRVDEDAKGTRCLTMAEVTLCLNALKRLALSLSSPIESPPADLDFEFAQRLQVILDRRKLTAVVPETVQFYVLSDKFVSEVVQELGPWLRALPSRQGAGGK